MNEAACYSKVIQTYYILEESGRQYMNLQTLERRQIVFKGCFNS